MHSAIPPYGETVRRARKARGMTQQAFAAELGKSQAVLSRYERGQVDPPTEVFMHCLHILDPPSPNAEQSFGTALSSVRSALDALRLALDDLQRAAVLNRDTATGHVPHSLLSGES